MRGHFVWGIHFRVCGTDCQAKNLPTAYYRLGSLGDEIRGSQFLPLQELKADIAYGKIVVRRSNWLECPLSDREADLGHNTSE
jgi:hypothetical protein